ncbi:cell wall-binding repeat-containing protein [Dactylosporangium aurantiacum]|uniref:Cell wall-binding repeat-containing protein n=1 Tax=Dactylosporangium aurantiacum TaxID=35754 RepID=A0A9Q9MJY2_9ACTN|nr:cell wall-binding repeat-containing protein [Dactylosporangium aurantiacum]MDG6107842.1 cell wall-binding repeat-containing protein [Dactylosporangium aurantiacum]UWZ57385.1 cell wall-binding repeat-containing protein [Dactylosporangium aurantiacum]
MSFKLTRRSAMLGAVAAATASAAAAGSQRPARASLPGQAGKITYRNLAAGGVWIANADGTDARPFVAPQSGTTGNWSPDGSRYVYGGHHCPLSVRADGSDFFELVPNSVAPGGEDPIYVYGGRYVVYRMFDNGNDTLFVTSSGGNWSFGEPFLGTPGDGKHSMGAAAAGDGTIVFEHHAWNDYANSDIYRFEKYGVVTKIIENGWGADFSPDSGRIAFVRSDSGGGSEIWLADADGGNQVQLTTKDNEGGGMNREPAWSPQGDAILFTSYHGNPTIKRIDLATKAVVTVVEMATNAEWQPVTQNVVERVWGATALDTAVATSRYNWADHGVEDGIRPQAQAVVLSRDDVYLDALGGSALAVRRQAPLLITPPGGLHASTRAEMQRILAPGGTVYLLGGTVALSAKVESQVKSLGYTVVRLSGATEYDTAIAIAKEIEPHPTAVIIATSLQYYDALAAGAAAGANPGTVIVLTAGDTMPAATAAYLNSLNPDPDTGSRMIGVGGPGVRALLNASKAGKLPSWPKSFWYWPVYGATEFETAVAVADFFFDGPRMAAVATATTWYDALTGGAMVGASSGPLLLSTPGALSPQTRDYFARNAASLKYATLLGGVLALKDSLVEPLGEAISLPGQYRYDQYTETYSPALARSLTARPARVRDTTPEIPGIKRQEPRRA